LQLEKVGMLQSNSTLHSPVENRTITIGLEWNCIIFHLNNFYPLSYCVKLAWNNVTNTTFLLSSEMSKWIDVFTRKASFHPFFLNCLRNTILWIK
jgi:hypothetical protein